MNRAELIEIIRDRSHLKRKEIIACLEIWEEEVGKALLQEDSVMLMGFGTFSLWKQTGRPGRNPRCNTPFMIAARNSVKFKPGKFLLEYLNNAADPDDSNGQPANEE